MSTSNRTKIVIIIMMVLLFSNILYGCDAIEQKSSIYDRNAKILQNGDSFNFMNRIGETDESRLNIRYNRFYGVQTIWIISVGKPSVIKIEFESNIKSGDFKVVLETADQELIEIVENKGKDSYKFNAIEGNYKIKIVGKNAYGNIKGELETGIEVDIIVQDNNL